MRDYKTTKPNKKNSGKMSREEYLYHNTEVLLKKYRDVVWSIEVSAIQAEISFELQMDCKLEEYLELSYAAGGDFSGTNIQEQMRTMERNKKMLKMIETAMDILRRKQTNGELYYCVIYYTYMSEKAYKSIDEVIKKIDEDMDEFLSWKRYYKIKKEAIEILGTILWGFATKECLPILNGFVD